MKQPELPQGVGESIEVSSEAGKMMLAWLQSTGEQARGLADGEDVARLRELLEGRRDAAGPIRLDPEARGAYLILLRKALGSLQANAETSKDVPSYIKGTRELWWRGRLILKLGRKAERQEAVLNAFEASGWPEVLANPIKEDRDTDAQSALWQTITDLNRKLSRKTIRFHRAGGGGVRWAKARKRR